VNKFIVIKSNTKNFDKSQLKTAKIKAKNFNSLQSYVKVIWVKTWKWQKWFGGDIITCWISDWPCRLL